MALVACADCGKEISDAAPACIHCGRPMSAPTNRPLTATEQLAAMNSPRHSPTAIPVVIEQTSKYWKKQILVAIGIFFGSFVFLPLGDFGQGMFVLGFFTSCGWLLYGLGGWWWNHA